ncbi:hypothetical protein LTR36_006156 [Oleoguttula mirabilis]|uniref:Uncharacterized protein n=1 Tax=Oleoguttula mirabilis TaxID=1507867 RepID=A0AAV9JD80_9PEZI|nr:hypothetical protein LTR36_006156 [Oleoguttula mirabilis]
MVVTAQTLPTATASASQAKGVFRMLDLPPELREHIYYLAIESFPVIDTAAVQDKVIIPAITQVSQQLRNEGLAVFYRNRPVEVSFHCDQNVRRAKIWAKSWADHAKDFTTIMFSGKMRATGYEFFHITVEKIKTAPYFKVHARPGVSRTGAVVVEHMQYQIEARLKSFSKRASSQEQAKLTAEQFPVLIEVVERASQFLPPAEPNRT